MFSQEANHHSDAELVEFIQNNQIQYFDIIVERYSKPIYNYLLRLLYFHIQDAEDGLSETFLKVFGSINSYNPKLKFSSWIYRIAHNQAVDMLRQKKHKTVPIEDYLEKFSFSDTFTQYQKEDLEKLLILLKGRDRNLLTLFYLEELSVTEIGAILKERPQTISVWLHRAKTNAQNKIRNYFK